MEEVFRAYGAPIGEEEGDQHNEHLEESNHALYRYGSKSRIRYSDYGLRFRFFGDAITQIVVGRI
jgi:hypothetical protein